MLVFQSGMSGNSVTLRVEYNPSGNCCGGTFNWDTGDGRVGSVPDGIQFGVYQGDASGAGNLDNGDPFTWTRTQPAGSNVPLVRIEITYAYANAGSYTVNWDDCCPSSGGSTTVVAGSAVTLYKILVLDTGHASITQSMADAAIPPCPGGPPLCYDKVLSADFASTILFPKAKLDTYKTLVVGYGADITAISALNVRKADIKTWVTAGGGLIVYSQTLATAYDWIPKDGPSVANVVEAADDVQLTAYGTVHPTHLDQAANGPNSLSGWGNSRETYFATWPAYFSKPAPVAGPLSRDGTGTKAVSLAGIVNGSGCVFMSGQPVDRAAAAGVLAARELFRSTVNYGVACPPP
jgi:hypothetical protein